MIKHSIPRKRFLRLVQLYIYQSLKGFHFCQGANIQRLCSQRLDQNLTLLPRYPYNVHQKEVTVHLLYCELTVGHSDCFCGPLDYTAHTGLKI